MWKYVQRTGQLSRDGQYVAHGYAGHGEGKNNPAMQTVKSVGPLPCGVYSIYALLDLSEGHGPYVLKIKADPGTKVFGRGGFLIHGDSISNPGQGSTGCICLPRSVREAIWTSKDHLLEVVAEPSAASQHVA